MLLNEIGPVYRRELKSYFQSPAAFVAVAIFVAFVGLIEFNQLKMFVAFSEQKSSMGQFQQMPPLNLTQMVAGPPLFGIINFMALILAPALTMRLISEEKRLGTFELLATCPLRDWAILLGKYFAAATVGLLTLALCAVIPILLHIVSGGMVEVPVILVGFLGSGLMILAFLAFGLFASSVTENQMLAAIVSFIGLLLLQIVGFLPVEDIQFFGLQLSEILNQVGLQPHLQTFMNGAISILDVLYFALFIAFFLYLTSKILEARRWRV